MELFIQISPIAKGRPRFSKRGTYVVAYTPKKTKDYEEELRVVMLRDVFAVIPKPTALSVSLVFHMPIPKSMRRKDITDYSVIRHTKKPDIDNLTKAVLDAANGIIWEDDSQIVIQYATKIYSESPGIYIRIEEIR